MKIIKRNGQAVDFDGEKIYSAVKKAYSRVYALSETADETIMDITKKVIRDINDLQLENVPITIVQAYVEQRLLDAGLTHVAEKYIEYRIERDIDRYGYGDDYIVRLHLEKIK